MGVGRRPAGRVRVNYGRGIDVEETDLATTVFGIDGSPYSGGWGAGGNAAGVGADPGAHRVQPRPSADPGDGLLRLSRARLGDAEGGPAAGHEGGAFRGGQGEEPGGAGASGAE